MITLPLCRWRDEADLSRPLCNSPFFLAAPNVVAAEACAECACADHAPPPPLPPALPCVHLGGALDDGKERRGEPELFRCAKHGRCMTGWTSTLPREVRSCAGCADYLPRDPFTPDSGEMSERAGHFLARLKAYPGRRYQGRGVVIAGGGERYFPALYVTVRALRHVGCTLPIQVWYLGRNGEMPRSRKGMLGGFGVECIDADEVRKKHPARMLDGWELKVFATLHSSFQEVLFLDADCYPCRNPEFLFDLDEYRRAGAIFWADCVLVDDRLKWAAFGLDDPKRLGSIESGQYVIHKQLSWKALNLAWFYNDHSDYYYRYCYGDKHTFEAAWNYQRQPFVMFTPIAHVEKAGYVHTGPDHRPLFVHRCSDKFRLNSQEYPTPQRHSISTFYPSLPLERECWGWLNELAVAFRAPVRCPEGVVRKPANVAPEQITLATLHTPEIAAFGRWSTRVLKEYARRHGYKVLAKDTPLDAARPASWSKIPLTLKAFEDDSCQWLFWLDADALITRFDVPLTAFVDDDADFIVADDSPHSLLNMGAFLIRNCPATRELMRRAYEKTEFLHHHWWEQPAIVDTIQRGVRGLRVKIVPRGLFNSFAPEYQEGQFVIHFAGASFAERRAGIRRRAVSLLHPLTRVFRAGSTDAEIFNDVATLNEYRLPDDMTGITVLDIGAHVGSFAHACATRGAADIWCVEAHPENFAALQRTYEEVQLPGMRPPIFGAAWRSDRLDQALLIHDGDWINRGGRCLNREQGAPTTLLAFDDIVRQATNGGRTRINLLKLDCEGAEFPILFTSRTLALIDAICAEVHFWVADRAEFQVEGQEITEASLRRRLEEHGFDVTIEANHLWARRATYCD